MKTATGLVYLLACLLEPFMPSFSVEVLKQLNMHPDTQISLTDEHGDIDRSKRPWEFLPAGHKIRTHVPLFKELVLPSIVFVKANNGANNGEPFESLKFQRLACADLSERLKNKKMKALIPQICMKFSNNWFACRTNGLLVELHVVGL